MNLSAPDDQTSSVTQHKKSGVRNSKRLSKKVNPYLPNGEIVHFYLPESLDLNLFHDPLQEWYKSLWNIYQEVSSLGFLLLIYDNFIILTFKTLLSPNIFFKKNFSFKKCIKTKPKQLSVNSRNLQREVAHKINLNTSVGPVRCKSK